MLLFETLRPRQQLRYAFAVIMVLAAMWTVITSTTLVPPLFLPSPRAVLAQLQDGPTVTAWLKDAGASVVRVLMGFGLAVCLAIPVGILVGAWARFDALFSPVLQMARYIPVPALVPLCILWVGIDEAEKILVIFLGTFFQLCIAIALSVRSISFQYIEAARCLGLEEWSILRKVIIPAAWPSIFDAVRISLGWAWSYLVVAEIVSAGVGLGYEIMASQRYLQTGLVFFGLFVIAFLGLMSDLGFRFLRMRLFQWQ